MNTHVFLLMFSESVFCVARHNHGHGQSQCLAFRGCGDGGGFKVLQHVVFYGILVSIEFKDWVAQVAWVSHGSFGYPAGQEMS